MDIAFSIMKWPILACLLLPGMLVYLGLHVVRREIIFVDLALAQVAALGTSLCLMLGHEVHDLHTYLWSVGFTLVGAAVFALTRDSHHHRVPQEALIGIVYVVAAAAGLLMLSKTTEGNEELKRTLIGDVLLVQPKEIGETFALFAVVGLVHFVFRRQFVRLSFEPERARAEGMALRWWDFLFYALFGLVVTSFVQIGGVLLVFSYLIVPAVCANFLATRLPAMIAIGWITATLASMGGLWASYRFDFPTGAAIVCSLGLALLAIALYARLRGRPEADAADAG
jgi:zinc/manganese transport system permease protein